MNGTALLVMRAELASSYNDWKKSMIERKKPPLTSPLSYFLIPACLSSLTLLSYASCPLPFPPPSLPNPPTPFIYIPPSSPPLHLLIPSSSSFAPSLSLLFPFFSLISALSSSQSPLLPLSHTKADSHIIPLFRQNTHASTLVAPKLSGAECMIAKRSSGWSRSMLPPCPQ